MYSPLLLARTVTTCMLTFDTTSLPLALIHCLLMEYCLTGSSSVWSAEHIDDVKQAESQVILATLCMTLVGILSEWALHVRRGYPS